tara:strand:- start:286 stop:561 length:276 start_codon:yes stop_codon:yes gene_type:complete
MSDFGKELIADLQDSLSSNDKGRTVRPSPSDIKAIRDQQNMSQSKFAQEFHINIETLRAWEQGKRTPDSVSTAFLYCIQKQPNIIKDILNS